PAVQGPRTPFPCWSRGSPEEFACVREIHSFDDLRRQVQPAENRQRWIVGPWEIIRVGDRAGALPIALPQGALTPIAAGVMILGQVVSRHQVYAEEESPWIAAYETSNELSARRDLANLPLRRARVHVKVRVVLE